MTQIRTHIRQGLINFASGVKNFTHFLTGRHSPGLKSDSKRKLFSCILCMFYQDELRTVFWFCILCIAVVFGGIKLMRRESRKALVATYMNACDINAPRQSIIFDSPISPINVRPSDATMVESPSVQNTFSAPLPPEESIDACLIYN